MPSKSKAQREQEALEARLSAESLRRNLTPGTNVWTLLSHGPNRDGSRRSIRVLIILPTHQPDGAMAPEPWDVSGHVARVLGRRFDDKHGGVIVNGGGMDMGHALVNDLGRALYPDGYQCPGSRCACNTHGGIDREPDDGTVHHGPTGYVFNHRRL